MSVLLPVLHIGDSGQASFWMLGVTAGLVLTVAVHRLMRALE